MTRHLCPEKPWCEDVILVGRDGTGSLHVASHVGTEQGVVDHGRRLTRLNFCPWCGHDLKSFAIRPEAADTVPILPGTVQLLAEMTK